MMKWRLAFTAALLTAFAAFPGFSQAQDWQTACISGPYDYSYADETRQVVIDRFQANNITYWVADVQISSPEQLRAVIARENGNGQRQALSDIVAGQNAVLAINGDDYGTHRYGTIHSQRSASSRRTNHAQHADRRSKR